MARLRADLECGAFRARHLRLQVLQPGCEIWNRVVDWTLVNHKFACCLPRLPRGRSADS
eukprot:SAG31_NODE_1414_length_8451_cov_13.707016_6_plen_59_part_00